MAAAISEISRTGYDPAETTHEMLEYGTFPPVKLYVSRPDVHVPSDRVEADIARVQDHAQWRAWAAQECLGARHQFGYGERLDEIIVGTGI
jgi:hypothetical protein